MIRLADGASGFGDPAAPRPVLSTWEAPGFSANQFRNSIHDLTVDSGSGNPGAIGVRYHVNNQGTMRDVTVRSGDGAGVVGLEMTGSDAGPGMIARVTVEGFDVGIRLGGHRVLDDLRGRGASRPARRRHPQSVEHPRDPRPLQRERGARDPQPPRREQRISLGHGDAARRRPARTGGRRPARTGGHRERGGPAPAGRDRRLAGPRERGRRAGDRSRGLRHLHLVEGRGALRSRRPDARTSGGGLPRDAVGRPRDVGERRGIRRRRNRWSRRRRRRPRRPGRDRLRGDHRLPSRRQLSLRRPRAPSRRGGAGAPRRVERASDRSARRRHGPGGRAVPARCGRPRGDRGRTRDGARAGRRSSRSTLPAGRDERSPCGTSPPTIRCEPVRGRPCTWRTSWAVPT